MSNKIDANDAWWTASAASNLKKYIKNFGTQDNFARKACLSRSGLLAILAVKATPRYEKLLKICDVLGITPADILDPSPEAEFAAERFLHKASGNFVLVPFFEGVELSAGGGLTSPDYETVADGLPFPRPLIRQIGSNPTNLNLVLIRGDSMMPRLYDGDFVMVDRGQLEAKDGVFALRIADELLVKRVQWSAKDAVIISYSPDYNDYSLPRTDIEIIGRVVFAGARM